MGFTDDMLTATLIAHFNNNLAGATITDDRVVIVATIISPNGRLATLRSVWQILGDDTISFITAYPGGDL